MIAKMRTSSRQGTESRSAVDFSISSVKDLNRLFAINNAVSDHLLDEMQQVDWLSRPNARDDNLPQRYRLTEHLDVQWRVDRAINDLLLRLNDVAGTSYARAISTWHLCLSGSRCPLHTDGQKPNVMILYWHTPGPEFGTTFYNSEDVNDVLWQFAGTPNTGFFATTLDSVAWVDPGRACGMLRQCRYPRARTDWLLSMNFTNRFPGHRDGGYPEYSTKFHHPRNNCVAVQKL